MEVKAYSKTKDGAEKLSRNFRVREFACSDGTDPIFISPALVKLLQDLRDHFGAAITICSGYRTSAKNKAVGGAQYSQHLYGTAADITVKGVAPETVARQARAMLGNTGGVGRYKTFTHVDVRSQRADWVG